MIEFFASGSRPALAALAVVFVLVLLGFYKRPWLMLLPVVTVVSWIKGVIAIPTNINKALSYFALEKDAAAYAHHTAAATAILAAGPEYRAAGRELLARVCNSYGLAVGAELDVGPDGQPSGFPAAPGDFAHASRVAAASAVTQSRGGLKLKDAPAAPAAK